MSNYWSVHTHSRFSPRDAFPAVQRIVNKAAELNYPALALTDHGNMAGAVQLYNSCRKQGIEPLPGVEAYIVFDKNINKTNRSHMGMVATTQQGYRNLVSLVNQSHYNWKEFKTGKPTLDFADLAQASQDGRLEGVVATTGCWFGLLAKTLRNPVEDVDVIVSNLLKSLAGWFKSGLYVEIQNHLIYDDEHDDDLHSKLLYNLAQSNGLPIILAQDSHYIDPEEQESHDFLKRIVSFSADPDDACFPGDGYHMVDTDWMRDHHTPNIFSAGMEGLADLANKAKVVIPELDTYKLKVPDVTLTGNADKELRDKCEKSLNEKIENGQIPKAKKNVYTERLEKELDVLFYAGFSSYLLLTALTCEYMDEKEIFYNIRGSASGSLLCWLLGITSFDPIVWDLSFERFLTKDQTKPPDIDIDVEHERKADAEQFVIDRYHTSKIGTWSELNASLKPNGEPTGSLMVLYRSYMSRVFNIKLPTKHMPDQETWEKLLQISNQNSYSSYGVHAAGLMVSSTPQDAEVVPLMCVASSGTMVTALDKDDVETLGFPKLDFLGLRALSALKSMSELSGVKPEEIPLNDRKVFSFLSKEGGTNGVFQLEGQSASIGIRQLKPTKIADIIAAMALFRPATMESGATIDFIARRNKAKKIPTRHEIIEKETKDTYGVLLYQEQVIGVMRALGLEAEEIEKIRKAIKASNASVGNARNEIDKLLKPIKKLAKDKGMSESDQDWLEEAVSAYASYGFNKAHATAYGVMAYITGYYSRYHPLAFWTSMLNAHSDSKDKVFHYKLMARKAGITVRGPHVNISSVGYTADPKTNTIREGLTTVDKVSVKIATLIHSKAPFTSLDDFARRVPSSVGGVKDLGKGTPPEHCPGAVSKLQEKEAFSGLTRESNEK